MGAPMRPKIKTLKMGVVYWIPTPSVRIMVTFEVGVGLHNLGGVPWPRGFSPPVADIKQSIPV